MWRASSLLLLVVAGAAHAAAPCSSEGPALDPLFAMLKLDGLARLKARFSEDKHIDLLARPLHSEGTLYFDRALGIARLSTGPRAERVILSPSSLRIEKGARVEEIPLARSKPLRAFALIFPSLLRGERATLEAAFALRVCGSPREAWELELAPRDAGLRDVITRVVVHGQGRDVASLEVLEKSGDRTETRLSDITRNDAVPPAEITQAFEAR